MAANYRSVPSHSESLEIDLSDTKRADGQAQASDKLEASVEIKRERLSADHVFFDREPCSRACSVDTHVNEPFRREIGAID